MAAGPDAANGFAGELYLARVDRGCVLVGVPAAHGGAVGSAVAALGHTGSRGLLVRSWADHAAAADRADAAAAAAAAARDGEDKAPFAEGGEEKPASKRSRPSFSFSRGGQGGSGGGVKVEKGGGGGDGGGFLSSVRGVMASILSMTPRTGTGKLEARAESAVGEKRKR
jgi:hypothetical protein